MNLLLSVNAGGCVCRFGSVEMAKFRWASAESQRSVYDSAAEPPHYVIFIVNFAHSRDTNRDASTLKQ